MVNQNVDQDVNRNALISLLVLATVICIARSTVRWWKARALQIEDLFLWFALASFVSFCAMYLAALPILYRSLNVGMGMEKPWLTMDDDLKYLLNMFFAVQLLFWITLWSVKFSLLWMFRRLTLGLPRYGQAWIVIAVFTGVVFIGCVVSEFTSCSSVKAWLTPGACSLPSDAVRKAASLWYSLAVDLLTDLLIMAIPIRLLWNLQISRLEKISVGVAFSVGLITMIFATIRCVSLDSTMSGGTVSATWLVFWAAIEGFVVLAGSLPAFAVFLRGHVLSSSSRGTNPSNSTSAYNNPYNASAPSQHQSNLRSHSYNNTHTSYSTSSKSKSRIRAESVLLDDVAPPSPSLLYHQHGHERQHDFSGQQGRRGSRSGTESEAGLRDNTSWLTGVSDEEVGFGVGVGGRGGCAKKP